MPCITENLLPPEAAESRPKPSRPGVGVGERGKNLAGRFLPEVDGPVAVEEPLIQQPEALAPVVSPAPVAPVAPLPAAPAKRRGRPPNSDKAMTAAERKKAFRARKDQADEAAEMERLIEDIINKTRQGQSKPILSGAGVAWENRQKSNAAQLRILREGLEQLNLEDLRKYAATLKANSDHKGKLNNEHTGSIGPMSLPEAAQMNAERVSGKVGPGGAGPCDSDGDEDITPNKIVFASDLALHRYKEKAIDILLVDGVCTVCGQAGSQHLHDAFAQALQVSNYIERLESAGIEETILQLERGRLNANDHYKEIRKQMRLLLEQESGAGKKSRKMARLGKAEAAKRRRTERRCRDQQAKKEGWKI